MNNIRKITGFFALFLLAAGLTACENPEPPQGTGELAAPTFLNVVTNDVQAKLYWGIVRDATGYEVQIGTAEVVGGITKTEYTAADLTPQTQYTWRVRAVSGERTSEWTEGTPFKTEATASLPTPTGLTVVEVFFNRANVQWNAVEGAEKYEVRLDEDDNQIFERPSPSAAIIDLIPEAEYTVQVRAVNGDLRSAWSLGEVFTTLPTPGLPEKYKNMEGSYTATGTVAYVYGSISSQPTWAGEIMYDTNIPTDNPPSNQAVKITNPFAVTYGAASDSQRFFMNLRVFVFEDKLLLDDDFMIIPNADLVDGGKAHIMLSVLYLDYPTGGSPQTIYGAEGINHLMIEPVWDEDTKTLSLPTTFNGRPIGYGVFAYPVNGGLGMAMTNVYKDVVFTIAD